MSEKQREPDTSGEGNESLPQGLHYLEGLYGTAPNEQHGSTTDEQPNTNLPANEPRLSLNQLRQSELEWKERHALNPLLPFGPNRLSLDDRDELDKLRGRFGEPWRGPLLP